MSDPAVQFQFRQDTKSVLDGYTIATGELGMDTTRRKFRFGDGATLGGFRLARENWRDGASFTLAANTDNWAPAAFEELGVLVVSLTAPYNLTGLAGGTAGRDVAIHIDPASTGVLTLKHQAGTSVAANRFVSPTARDVVFGPGQSALLSYDATTSRWILRAGVATAISVVPAGSQQDSDVQAALDALAGRLVIGLTRTTLAPPGAPAQGASYLTPPGATGAWAGNTNKIATWNAATSAWVFTTPLTGQYVVSAEDDRLMRWSGTAWVVTSSTFYLNREITAPVTSVNADNWAPTGYLNASVIRFSTDQDGRKFTGLAGGDAGQVKVLSNVGNYSAIFSGEDTNSIAANRFSLGYPITVRPTETITLRYDATASRWTLIGRSSVAIKEIPGELYYTGTISPAIGAASTNDWAPAGFAGCSTIYVAPSVAAALTGLAGGADGREITIFNMNANLLTFKDQAAASVAANRLALGQYQSITFQYNASVNRWLLSATTVGVVSVATQVLAILSGSDTTNDTLFKVYTYAKNRFDALLTGADATIDTLKEVDDRAQNGLTAASTALSSAVTTSNSRTDGLVSAANKKAVAMAIALG